MNELPSRAAFAESLNTAYRITGDSGNTLELSLVELREGRSTPRQEQFSLLFRGPRNSTLPQGLYQLEHANLGTLDLLLVPVSRDDQGTLYEAVFNRLIQAE